MLCQERPFEHLSACILDMGHDGACHYARGKNLSKRQVDIFQQTRRGQSFVYVRTVTLPGEGAITREAMAEAWAASLPEISGQTALDMQS